jgi:hypothetical protein
MLAAVNWIDSWFGPDTWKIMPKICENKVFPVSCLNWIFYMKSALTNSPWYHFLIKYIRNLPSVQSTIGSHPAGLNKQPLLSPHPSRVILTALAKFKNARKAISRVNLFGSISKIIRYLTSEQHATFKSTIELNLTNSRIQKNQRT